MSAADEVLDEFVDYDADVDDIERIVEGNQSEIEQQSDDDEARSDELGEERQKTDNVRVEPKKVKIIRNPRITLNPARLTGPRGVQVIKDYFDGFNFKGKGHEKEDLDLIMKTLEHWAHRLYPKFTFDDCLEKIEHLGNKKLVSSHVRLIHLNMLTDRVDRDEGSDEDKDDTGTNAAEVHQEKDDFDLLLEQQIALARSTPSSNVLTPKNKEPTPFNDLQRGLIPDYDRFPLTPTNNHTHHPTIVNNQSSLSEEQKERILKNKQLAEERRKGKIIGVVNAPIDNRDKENVHNVSDAIDIDYDSETVVIVENDVIRTVTKNGDVLPHETVDEIVDLEIDKPDENRRKKAKTVSVGLINDENEPVITIMENVVNFTNTNCVNNEIIEINDEPEHVNRVEKEFSGSNIVDEEEHTTVIELVYHSDEENENICSISRHKGTNKQSDNVAAERDNVDPEIMEIN